MIATGSTPPLTWQVSAFGHPGRFNVPGINAGARSESNRIEHDPCCVFVCVLKRSCMSGCSEVVLLHDKKAVGSGASGPSNHHAKPIVNTGVLAPERPLNVTCTKTSNGKLCRLTWFTRSFFFSSSCIPPQQRLFERRSGRNQPHTNKSTKKAFAM